MLIVLASSSTSRRELLGKIVPDFQVIPSHLDESRLKKQINDPEVLTKRLALAKAAKVAEQLRSQAIKEWLVIGADSVAAMKLDKNWRIFDKPASQQQAKQMILSLRGQSHSFYTGLAIINYQGKEQTTVVKSTVYFKEFSRSALVEFLSSKLWQGRAGGYGIRECLGTLIDRYEGSYTNILGLPLEKLRTVLEKSFGCLYCRD